MQLRNFVSETDWLAERADSNPRYLVQKGDAGDRTERPESIVPPMETNGEFLGPPARVSRLPALV
jgi:hypothetical protein